MRGTILYKLFQWIVASSASILAVLISVFFIIFSLYPDLVKEDDLEPYKLKTYYYLCDKSKTNSVEVREYEVKETTSKEDSTTQIILFDKTASVETDTTNFGNFKKTLVSFITKSKDSTLYFKTDQILDEKNLNSLIYFTCIKSLYNSKTSTNKGNCIFYLYNGTNDKGDKVKGDLDHVIDSICSFIHKPYESKKMYYTNIKTIIDTLSKFIDGASKFNLTIISDFYHDDTLKLASISNCDMENLRNSIGNNSMNLIIIDHTKLKKNKYIVQNDFLSKYLNHFEGTNDDTINHFLNIDLENYTNEFYCDCDTSLLEFEEIFKLNQNKIENLIFYTPISNHNKLEVATAKLRIVKKSGNNKHNINYKWKFRNFFNDNSTVILHTTNDTTKGQTKHHESSNHYKRYLYNPSYHDSVNQKEILELELKMTPNAASHFDDLGFYISYNDGVRNHFQRFNVEIRRTKFSDEYKTVLERILDLFCFLLLTIIISGEFLVFQHIVECKCNLCSQNIGSKQIYCVIGVIFTIVSLLLFCFFLWGTSHWLPNLTLVVSVVIIFINILLFIPFTREKLEKLQKKLKEKLNYLCSSGKPSVHEPISSSEDIIYKVLTPDITQKVKRSTKRFRRKKIT